MAGRGKEPTDPRTLTGEDAALISRDCMRATLMLMGALPPPVCHTRLPSALTVPYVDPDPGSTFARCPPTPSATRRPTTHLWRCSASGGCGVPIAAKACARGCRIDQALGVGLVGG